MHKNAIILCFLIVFVNASDNGIYLNTWAVEVKDGDEEANKIAEFHGFRNLGKIGSLENIYAFEHHEVHKRSLSPSRHHHTRLLKDPKVKWVEQQVAKKRVKRGGLPHKLPNKLPQEWKGLLNDHLWPKMWYMHGGADGGYDMNVLKAWDRGYSGKGVVVTILDDGIEHSHPDLKPNYDPAASNDINGHDDDPMPRYDSRDENRHGTRCAGEVAAIGNNSKCVVGLAFNANIGGVRMLDGDVSDLVEASALGHNPQHVDIYSASWGPDDNGKVVDGPAKLAEDTFVSGVLNGRKGKGSIFVWASGNGGSLMDSCSCDGYTNSIFTLSVSSVSEHNTKPWYLEECASTLATTYSSGENYHDKKILTTDLHGRCTEQHTGTSASAPLAAALIALALEANPELTWRDMQYLVIHTSNTKPFQDAEWVTNSLGRKVSLRYGYGLMDAEALVKTAERWTTVPAQHICNSDSIRLDQPLDGEGIELKIDANGCEDTKSHIQYLEHVQAKVTLRYSRRGDIEIYLVSPSGTRSKLLPHRKNDHLEGTFSEWPFMSVFFWGENPKGTWRLQIVNVGTKYNHGIIEKWQLILYGTAEQPVNLKPESKYPPNRPPYKPGDHENEVDKDNETSHSGEDYGEIDQGKHSGDENTVESGEYECHSECDEEAGCTGPTLQDCLACKHLRLMPQGICVPDCPHNAYFTDSTATCTVCETPCNKCEGPDLLSDCQGCIQGYYLVEGLGQCLAQCREGTYEAPDDNVCLPCAVGCTVCTGSPDHCTLCQPGYHLQHNSCVMHCAPREYKDPQNRCSPCHESCWSCFGPSSEHCSRCVDDLLYQNGTCIRDCMQGYYTLETTEGIYCQPCHESCLECIGPEMDECAECYQPLKLAGGVCLQTCPLGAYDNGYGLCGGCHMTCNTCHGPDYNQCLSCDFGHWLQDGECVSFCKVGYYPFEAYTDMGDRVSECLPCHTSCESCRGGLVMDCVTCHLGLVLTGRGDCLTECPVGYVHDEMGTCLLCSDSCLSCAGPAPTDCTACETGLVLLAGECLVGGCPEEFYLEGRVCYRCHHTCQLCIGPGAAGCTVCSSGFVRQGELCADETQTYVISCDIGQYFDKDQGSCLVCHSMCSSCVGPGPTDCLSCTPPSVYLPHYQQCLLCCTIHVTTAECCVCIPGESICRDENFIGETTLSSSTSLKTVFNSKYSSSSSSATVSSEKTVIHHDATATTQHIPPLLHHSTLSSKHYPTSSHDHVTIDTSHITTTKTTTIATTNNSASSLLSKHWVTMVTFLVFACVFSVGVFFLIFGLLQARSNEQLCWGRHRYQPVPTLYQNGSATTKVKVSSEDYTTDDEIDDDSYQVEEALYQKA